MGRQAVAARAALACALVLPAGAALGQGPMSSSPPVAEGAREDFDVNKLFANTCGWCHSSGGRAAGRGPRLMDSKLTDAEIVTRIKQGKPGAMPAFATAFDEAQLQAIVRYIRALKPEGAAP